MNSDFKRNYTMLTDAYELFMANTYIQTKKDLIGVFDVTYRVVPNSGGYVIMAGLSEIIDYVKNLNYTSDDIEYFKNNNYNFCDEFYEYLKNFKFTGDIYSIEDGTPVFPNEPLLTIKAPLMEAQLLETAILAIINGACKHATAARRIIESTPKNVKVMEFGARRADGMDAANNTSIYALMAGCSGTSNVQAAKMAGIRALGTMAHSFVEVFDDELSAFKTFAKFNPNNVTLLVDTYDTLRSGVPNAIKTFDWMKENNMDLSSIGIRIDSGDLSWLSKQARNMLDNAGYSNAKICLSNGLKAETIESLILQGAKFDSLGVGDNISDPDGRIGAVYKLVATIKDDIITPRIKLSEDLIKITNPDFKDLYRAYDKNTGFALADIMCSKGKEISKNEITIVSLNDLIKSTTIDNYNLVKLQKTIFENGKLVYNDKSLNEKIKYCESQMQKIYPEIKRLLNPHVYYVDGTLEYAELKRKMIKDKKERR